MQTDIVYNEDCLKGIKKIPDGSIDLILCDLPYGTTKCEWDKCLNLEVLWSEYKRIITNIGIICLFGSEPFSTKLKMRVLELYKYDWIWVKNNSTGFMHAKNQPLKNYENISVFSKASIGHKNLLKEKRMTYNPQGLIKINTKARNSLRKKGGVYGTCSSFKNEYIKEYTNYPTMILKFSHDKQRYHPTQKPIALLEYLIKTYTNENDIVLDNCCGSGSTLVACKNLNRRFISFELDKKYYNITLERLKNNV